MFSELLCWLGRDRKIGSEIANEDGSPRAVGENVSVQNYIGILLHNIQNNMWSHNKNFVIYLVFTKSLSTEFFKDWHLLISPLPTLACCPKTGFHFSWISGPCFCSVTSIVFPVLSSTLSGFLLWSTIGWLETLQAAALRHFPAVFHCLHFPSLLSNLKLI